MPIQMTPVRPPRSRRMAPLLLFGVIWLVACWSWVLISVSTSLPHHPVLSASLPPVQSSNIGVTNKQFGRNDLQNTYTTKQTRNLSSSMHNSTRGNLIASRQFVKNDSNHHLRAKPVQTPPHNNLNESAPFTPFIYPLHAKSGTHHAHIYIGTPPQRQTLIVDTGSRLTAFPCHPHCPNCGKHTSKPFHLSASSSHDIVPCDQCKLNLVDFPLEDYFEGDGIGGNSGDGPSLRGTKNELKTNQQRRRNLFPNSCVNNQCELDQRYTEGSSWKAFEVRDKVWLGLDEKKLAVEEHDKYSVPFVFGCQVSEHGLFKTQYADGIMGLSMYTQTLPGVWHQQGSIPHESFSLCFNAKGGHISLGGIGSAAHGSTPQQQEQQHTSSGRHLAPMQFTPFAKENVWYYTVTVTSISVGEHVLPKSMLQFVNDNKGTIVDSGTTDTFISHKLAKAFIFAWEKITGRRYNNRLQKYTYQQFNKLPVITFELDGGIQWDIDPKYYMEAQIIANETANNSQWEGNRGFTSRVYVDEPQGVVLGSNAMMDKEIYFDMANR
ncbi:hypothetical protein ACHAXR_004412, partial [Thalassiosira sp. AJA248-18]